MRKIVPTSTFLPKKPISILLIFLLIFGIAAKTTYGQTPWFQVQGRVHSQGRTPDSDLSDAIKSLLPAGKTFNSSRGLTSGRGTINVGSGSVSSPTPIPILERYRVEDFSNLSYTALKGRMQSSPTLITAATLNVSPNNGVYVTSGNLDINGIWDVGADPTSKFIAIFVNGELIVSNNITVRKGAFLAFVVKGDISVKKNVTSLEGLFYTDGKLCTKCQSSGVVDN